MSGTLRENIINEVIRAISIEQLFFKFADKDELENIFFETYVDHIVALYLKQLDKKYPILKMEKKVMITIDGVDVIVNTSDIHATGKSDGCNTRITLWNKDKVITKNWFSLGIGDLNIKSIGVNE